MDQLKKVFGDRILENEPMSKHTTLEIGGPTKAFLEVTTKDELIQAIKLAGADSLPTMVIGSGSNLLVSDAGYDGLIIKNSSTGISENNGEITVTGGTLLQDLVNYTIEHNFDGMSTMTGVPGTVAGAIYGSAGAYGDNIRDYLFEISCFDGQNIVTISKDEYHTGYRDSIFKHQKNLIILAATFEGFPDGNKTEILQECQEVLQKRAEKYPPDTKCPGSFFKNVIVSQVSPEILAKIPPEKIKFGKIPAGFLLEMVGAKGQTQGQIKISEKHANTIFNLGNGNAQDFYNLAKKYSQLVHEKFHITLEPEVQLINLPPI